MKHGATDAQAGQHLQHLPARYTNRFVANGLGSGILMTIGADLADKSNPAPFLGAWRFTGNSGGAASPLLLAGITAVSSIAIAAGAMGVLGLIGAGVLLRFLPRYIPRPHRN